MKRIVLFLLVISFATTLGFSETYTVAVLNFQNVTKDKSYDWFSSALSESLISELTKISGVLVIERNQLSQVLTEIETQSSGLISDKDAVSIGKMKGAKSVVLGSFLVTPKQIKIYIRSINIESGIVEATADFLGVTGDEISIIEQAGKGFISTLLQKEIVKSILVIKSENELKKYLEAGITAYNKKDYKLCINLLEDYTLYGGTSIDANYYHGQALVGMNRKKEAVVDFEKYLSKNNNNYQIFDFLINFYFIENEFGKVIFLFNDHLKTTNLSQKDSGILVNSYISNNDGNSGIITFTKEIKKNPQAAFLYQFRSYLYLQAFKDSQNALSDAKEAIRFEKSFWSYFRMAEAYNLMGEYQQVIDTLNKAQKMEPKNGIGYWLMGEAYMSLGQHEIAMKAFKTGMDLGDTLARDKYLFYTK